MLVDDFDFELPRDLIAQRPVQPRDHSRLLHVGDKLGDHHFYDLPDLVNAGDVMVFNDTRVIPARLIGYRAQARVEVTLHKKEGPGRWVAFVKGAKKLKIGDQVDFQDDFKAKVLEKKEGGEVTFEFDRTGADLMKALEQTGAMPLPPYIKRDNMADEQDKSDYQTVYAAKEGAVAAPTAGLHYTPELLQKLQEKGVLFAHVTLHVGAGTFLPVKVDHVDDHKMHSEYGLVTVETAQMINQAKSKGGRVIAVGTTSLRLLESAALGPGQVGAFDGDTDIFITPGFDFKIADVLTTNFHLPRSTLFMLVSAFCGQARMKQAYAHAIEQGYRFYSYGDGSFLERQQS